MSEEYIKNTSKKSSMSVGKVRIGSIYVMIKDNFTNNNIDLDSVLREVSRKVPDHFLDEIDYVIVGQFSELNSRSVNAAYMDGAIYVTNEQDDEDDLIDDIIHEIAHAVHDKYPMEIFSDGKIESEFISKRERLFHLLSAHEEIDLEYQNFLEPEYSREFDNFLYYHLGYPLLAAVSVNLFYSPYEITSLHEYFACGFETYFNKRDHGRLATISPILFDKLEKLDYNKEK